MKKKALVCGAGGFIGNHLVTRLVQEGFEVTGVDLVYPEFNTTDADNFIIGDLRDQLVCDSLFADTKYYDEVYQLAADMGGAGYIFTGLHDADVMSNSALINLNVINYYENIGKIFFSSSACVYNLNNQLDPNNPICTEASAYPAEPDSEYGWEKLFSERVYLAYNRNYDIPVAIARFHNVFGPRGAWNNGKEKVPAAMCRKVAEATDYIEIWGDGKQTRSFTYIDECLDGMRKLMDSDFTGPVNIGSDEMISINDFAKMIMNIAGKDLEIRHIDGPIGVRARTSDNKLIYEKLNWKPMRKLYNGMVVLYKWIKEQVDV